jgi:hypothetical protein
MWMMAVGALVLGGCSTDNGSESGRDGGGAAETWYTITTNVASRVR